MQDKKTAYLYEVRQLHIALRQRWKRNRLLYTALQVIIVAGATSVATLLNTQVSKEVSAIISIFVVIATVASNLSRFDQRSHINRIITTRIEKELRFYDLKLGEYKGIDDEKAFDHFVEAIEALKEERIQQIITLETSTQNQSMSTQKAQ